MNKFAGMGRVVRDPELRQTPNGVSVVNFTVAVNRRYRNAEGGYDADFLDCVAWRKTAEFIAKYFTKGKMIAVAGSVQTRKYQDKNGNNRVATEVVVDEAHFCGESRGREGDVGTNYEDVPEDMELPF